MPKQTKLLGFLFLSSLALGACSNGAAELRENLGLNKQTPDEFAVLTRAPLEMPSSMTLPQPSPGLARPQEEKPQEIAQNSVFGKTETSEIEDESSAESALLQKAGAQSIDPSIRHVLNKETSELSERNKTVAQKILDVGKSSDTASASVVDAEKEMKRILDNKNKNKDITEGETPIIEQ